MLKDAYGAGTVLEHLPKGDGNAFEKGKPRTIRELGEVTENTGSEIGRPICITVTFVEEPATSGTSVQADCQTPSSHRPQDLKGYHHRQIGDNSGRPSSKSQR